MPNFLLGLKSSTHHLRHLSVTLIHHLLDSNQIIDTTHWRKMAPSFVSSQSPYLRHLAGVTGVVPLLLGLRGFINPHFALDLLKFPLPSTATSEGLASVTMAENLLLLWAARAIFMGGIILTSWATRNTNLLGVSMILASFVAFADGYATWLQLGEGQWSHWSIIPIILPTGFGLLGLFD